MDTETLKVSDIERLLWQSPAGKELLLQRQREEERLRLVAEIQTLREEQARALPSLKKAQEEAQQAVLEAHQALEKLKAEARGKESAYSAVAARLTHWISRNENALRRSASPLIEEFIQQCRRAAKTARDSFAATTVPTGERGFESGRPIVRYQSNADTIQRDVQKLAVAITAAEELKLRALTDDEVATRLRELSETVPAQAQEVLIVDDPYSVEDALRLREQSELMKMSQPIKDIKRSIRASLGISGVRPLRR